MLDNNNQSHTYHVGDIIFIVTPVYPVGKGETMFSILFKLMKAELDKI